MEYNTRIDLITFLIENIIEIYNDNDNFDFSKDIGSLKLNPL